MRDEKTEASNYGLDLRRRVGLRPKEPSQIEGAALPFLEWSAASSERPSGSVRRGGQRTRGAVGGEEGEEEEEVDAGRVQWICPPYGIYPSMIPLRPFGNPSRVARGA